MIFFFVLFAFGRYIADHDFCSRFHFHQPRNDQGCLVGRVSSGYQRVEDFIISRKDISEKDIIENWYLVNRGDSPQPP